MSLGQAVSSQMTRHKRYACLMMGCPVMSPCLAERKDGYALVKCLTGSAFHKMNLNKLLGEHC